MVRLKSSGTMRDGVAANDRLGLQYMGQGLQSVTVRGGRAGGGGVAGVKRSTATRSSKPVLNVWGTSGVPRRNGTSYDACTYECASG